MGLIFCRKALIGFTAEMMGHITQIKKIYKRNYFNWNFNSIADKQSHCSLYFYCLYCAIIAWHSSRSNIWIVYNNVFFLYSCVFITSFISGSLVVLVSCLCSISHGKLSLLPFLPWLTFQGRAFQMSPRERRSGFWRRYRNGLFFKWTQTCRIFHPSNVILQHSSVLVLQGFLGFGIWLPLAPAENIHAES